MLDALSGFRVRPNMKMVVCGLSQTAAQVNCTALAVRTTHVLYVNLSADMQQSRGHRCKGRQILNSTKKIGSFSYQCWAWILICTSTWVQSLRKLNCLVFKEYFLLLTLTSTREDDMDANGTADGVCQWLVL